MFPIRSQDLTEYLTLLRDVCYVLVTLACVSGKFLVDMKSTAVRYGVRLRRLFVSRVPSFRLVFQNIISAPAYVIPWNVTKASS